MVDYCLGLPADIVPSTFKKKRVAAAAPRVKGDDDEEKPGKAYDEETSRPTGMGRGSRWEDSNGLLMAETGSVSVIIVPSAINS